MRFDENENAEYAFRKKMSKKLEEIRGNSEGKGCEGKQKYRSQKHAHDVAVTIMKHRRNVKLREYQCTRCYHWHLTSHGKVRWYGD